MDKFLGGWSKEVLELVKALGVENPEGVQHVVVDIPADNYVTVYVKRIGPVDVPSAVEALASTPLKPKIVPTVPLD